MLGAHLVPTPVFLRIWVSKICQATSRRLPVLRFCTHESTPGREIFSSWMFVQVMGGWCSSRLPQQVTEAASPINFRKINLRFTKKKRLKESNIYLVLCLVHIFLLHIFKKITFQKQSNKRLQDVGCEVLVSELSFQESDETFHDGFSS